MCCGMHGGHFGFGWIVLVVVPTNVECPPAATVPCSPHQILLQSSMSVKGAVPQ